MNRQILRLAIPNIISNVTIPLLGMIDLAIAGRIGNDTVIGAVALGGSIIGFIYWNFAFIRMGTSGLTAQAYGAGDKKECANLLGRSVAVAVVIAFLLLLFQGPLGRFSLLIMKGSTEATAFAKEYFYARIWAAPAAIGMFALHGWLIGMQDSTTPMVVSIINNLINIGCSVWFVFGFHWGVAGIAWGTVAAQYSALLITLVFILWRYRDYVKLFELREIIKLKPLTRFFRVNTDAFLRTLFINAAYTFFTAVSARYGDTMLATNELLMQLFLVYSYLSDGFNYAAESLTGRFVGARDASSLRKAVKALMWWCAAVAALYVVAYVGWWRPILGFFSQSPTILACAKNYVLWVVMVPVLGFVPFLMDGILIGATKTRIMRNTTFGALVVYLSVYLMLSRPLGNTGLWIAFLSFIVARGVFMIIATDKLNIKLLMNTDHV